jgi:chromosomal replication initiation ATPase DnaA
MDKNYNKKLKNFSQLNLFSQEQNFLNFEDLYAPEKYIITNSNLLVASYLFDIQNWTTDKICLLHGPRFSGKTHLSYIAHKKNIDSIFINKENMNLISDHQIIEQKNFIVLDDLDFFSEEVLFHFFNNIRFQEKFLLLSADDEFLSNIKLNDLRSRICSVPNFHLYKVDEHLLRGIIIKTLSDHDIVLNSRALKFICLNLERSYKAIHSFVKKIKKYVLENSAKIPMSFLKKILENQ